MRGLSLLFAVAIAAANGCAAMQAANLPPKKDLNVLAAGTPRSMVVAELGTPVHTMNHPTHHVDTFAFTQGYSRTAKTMRVAGHIAGDVATAFVWELAGIPIEAAFSGEPVQVEVGYDPQLRVSWVTYLKGQHLAETGITAPNWMQPPEFAWRRREAHVAASEPASGPHQDSSAPTYTATPTAAFSAGPPPQMGQQPAVSNAGWR